MPNASEYRKNVDYYKKMALDRLDNSKGYVISNVVPCCGPCNRMRGDYVTAEEMRVAMQTVKAFRLEKILKGVI